MPHNPGLDFETDFDRTGTYSGKTIDLNERLVPNRSASFFLQMNGNSMINAGIHDGDILIVDRSRKPQNGLIVIVVLDGEMLVRRYERTLNKLRLIPETHQLSPIEISEFAQYNIWGVVHGVIRIL